MSMYSKLQILSLTLLGLVLAAGTSLAWSEKIEEPFFIEPAMPHASRYFPQAVVDALDPQGLLLFTYSNGRKMPVCEIFWVKTAAGQDVSASRNRAYGNLRRGALVGVIHYLAEASEDYRDDFQHQELRPGYYTMRYAVLPDSDTKDFLLLSPVSLDHNPHRVLSFDQLVHLSRMTSGTKEPAIMSLAPVAQVGNEFPAVKTDDGKTWTVQVMLHIKPTAHGALRDIPLAMVVVTPKQEKNGAYSED